MDNEKSPSLDCILILGVSGRCGTNFLLDALALHEDIFPVQEVWEDYLVQNLHHLQAFSDSTKRDWDATWPNIAANAEALQQAIFGACIQFLRAKSHAPAGGIALSKSPSLMNLNLAARLPATKSIVLLRDGRDVVVSAMRTFGWSLSQSCQHWKRGAETLAKHLSAEHAFLLVRYEDLFRCFDAEVRKILEFVGLNEARYDFEHASRLPVRGSSTFGRGKKRKVHWEPIERSSEFKPIGRWSSWTARQRELFEECCGTLNRQLGYDSSPN